MLKKKLARVALITLTASAALGAGPSSCSSVPSHSPYLLDLARNRCIKYTLKDADKLIYQAQGEAPCSDLQGGFGFPAGQAEALIDYLRKEKAACSSGSQ